MAYTDRDSFQTAAFESALVACRRAAPTGRGVVVAPAPGLYLLKPLEFFSDVELRIDAGATVKTPAFACAASCFLTF